MFRNDDARETFREDVEAFAALRVKNNAKYLYQIEDLEAADLIEEYEAWTSYNLDGLDTELEYVIEAIDNALETEAK